MNFEPVVDFNDCDPTKPLIYAWHIGESLYIGKAMHGEKRALNEYRRNMRNILTNKPYHNGGPFRGVHYAMYDAWIDGRPLRLQYLENCDHNDLATREGYYVDTLKPDLNRVKPRPRHRLISVGTRSKLSGALTDRNLQTMVEYIDQHGPQTEDVLMTKFKHRSGCKAHQRYPQSKHNQGFIGYCLKSGWLRYVDSNGKKSQERSGDMRQRECVDGFKVTDRFDVCGHVPKRYIKKLIKAIEAVPQSIEIKELDERIVENLKPKTRTDFSPFSGCRFNCDIAIPNWQTLVEIEKGKSPRLELDILKFQVACLQSDWKYGVLIVPSTHIKLVLAGRSTPVEYLKRLKRMIAPLDMNLAVIGYEDPRAEF